MKIKPVSDFLFAKIKKGEEKTKGGIIIPSESIRETALAKVTHTGPGAETIEGVLMPMSCEVGDTIIFNEKGFINPVNIFGEEYIVLRGVDVIAIVEGIEEVEDTRLTLEDIVKALDTEGENWNVQKSDDNTFFVLTNHGRVVIELHSSHGVVVLSCVENDVEKTINVEDITKASNTSDFGEWMTGHVRDILDIEG